jgi:protein-S-isoprenylcysteine O-methyltransferase Ste14
VHLRVTLIGVLWMAWVLIWIGTAVLLRPESRDPAPKLRRSARLVGFRLLLAVFIVLAIRTHRLGGSFSAGGVGWVGVAACAAGLGFATWARLCLGHSWGMPMTVRAVPMLVRRGPYRVVRHPIYSGLLLAIIGSSMATGPGLLVAAIAGGAYFIASLRVEEADMAAAFPDEYREYASHTKRLIPFVY